MRVLQHHAILFCQVPFITSCIPDIPVKQWLIQHKVFGAVGRRGVKGPKQRRKSVSTGTSSQIFRGLQVFFRRWLFSNVSGRITGMGTWFSKWLKQWLLISWWWHSYTVLVVLLWSSLYARQGFLFSKACLCRWNAVPLCSVSGESEQPRALQTGPAVSTRVPESGSTRPDTAVWRRAFLHPRLGRHIAECTSYTSFQGTRPIGPIHSGPIFFQPER